MNLLRCAAILAALAGCAHQNWEPGPNAQTDIGSASGQCKLLAMSGGSSTIAAAAGRPAFVGAVVGASILASVVGNSIRSANIYNACMESLGFTPMP